VTGANRESYRAVISRVARATSKAPCRRHLEHAECVECEPELVVELTFRGASARALQSYFAGRPQQEKRMVSIEVLR
jgi:hypothetical protein